MRMANNMIFFVGVMLLLGIIAGCMPVVKTYVCPDGKQVSDPSMCVNEEAQASANSGNGEEDNVKTIQTSNPSAEEVNEKEESAPAPPEPALVEVGLNVIPLDQKELGAKLVDLLDQNAKVKTVSYNYFYSEVPYTDNQYDSSVEKLKIEIVNKRKYNDEEPYDMIYIDFVNKIAKGYCETESPGTCEDRNKPYALDYATFWVPTPFAWVDCIESAELTGRSKQIEGRQGKEVTFKSGGVSGIMWLDAFYGIPIEVSYDGIDYKYQNLRVNDISADLLVHQKLADIP
ncbi:hypothetical protein JW711_02325 [Candidatus Woesearchaeota archaeon]|nr:hypothetical protein [Candidatus Woesearchaeota archaeon]